LSRCKILARWIITYLAAELEEDAEWGEDDGDEDVDAVRRALLHLARSVDLWSPGGYGCVSSFFPLVDLCVHGTEQL
jgi:hypothetical protein